MHLWLIKWILVSQSKKTLYTLTIPQNTSTLQLSLDYYICGFQPTVYVSIPSYFRHTPHLQICVLKQHVLYCYMLSTPMHFAMASILVNIGLQYDVNVMICVQSSMWVFLKTMEKSIYILLVGNQICYKLCTLPMLRHFLL